MIDLVVVLIALGLLMYLAFRGVTLILLRRCRAARGAADRRPADPRRLHAGLHDQHRRLHRRLLSPVHAGRHLRQADGRHRLGKSIARAVSGWLGPERAIVSVVLCCAV
jgi:hypothetical protein